MKKDKFFKKIAKSPITLGILLITFLISARLVLAQDYQRYTIQFFYGSLSRRETTEELTRKKIGEGILQTDVTDIYNVAFDIEFRLDQENINNEKNIKLPYERFFQVHFNSSRCNVIRPRNSVIIRENGANAININCWLDINNPYYPNDHRNYFWLSIRPPEETDDNPFISKWTLGYTRMPIPDCPGKMYCNTTIILEKGSVLAPPIE